MNETTNLIKKHATIRRFFSDYTISEEMKNEIIEAPKQALSCMDERPSIQYHSLSK